VKDKVEATIAKTQGDKDGIDGIDGDPLALTDRQQEGGEGNGENQLFATDASTAAASRGGGNSVSKHHSVSPLSDTGLDIVLAVPEADPEAGQGHARGVAAGLETATQTAPDPMRRRMRRQSTVSSKIAHLVKRCGAILPRLP
jgi:hypothetical protein